MRYFLALLCTIVPAFAWGVSPPPVPSPGVDPVRLDYTWQVRLDHSLSGISSPIILQESVSFIVEPTVYSGEFFLTLYERKATTFDGHTLRSYDSCEGSDRSEDRVCLRNFCADYSWIQPHLLADLAKELELPPQTLSLFESEQLAWRKTSSLLSRFLCGIIEAEDHGLFDVDAAAYVYNSERYEDSQSPFVKTVKIGGQRFEVSALLQGLLQASHQVCESTFDSDIRIQTSCIHDLHVPIKNGLNLRSHKETSFSCEDQNQNTFHVAITRRISGTPWPTGAES